MTSSLGGPAVWRGADMARRVDDPDQPRDLYRLWLTLRRDIALPTAFQTGGITDRTAAYS